MLVLSRKVGQRICVADTIELTVLEVRGKVVRLGFTAPPEVTIHRQEVCRPTKPQVAQTRARVGAV